ncbi:MAG: hypothetical protein LBD53_07195 [Tannerella sp.]|nr:hypothetical protein [Tannerella sp.]
MKKSILKSSLALFGACLLFSCFDDNRNIHASYGVIQDASSKNYYQILTDKGNTLIVTESYTSQSIENGKRVFANFEVKSDKDSRKKIYEVKVNGFYQLLSKPVVNESYVLANEEVRRDSIGNDPFIDVYAWFGGDYININFEAFFKNYSSVKHLINLVYDDTRSTSDTLYLSLKHNAYGETANNNMYLHSGIGRCSFLLSNLLAADIKYKPVKLTWLEYRYDGHHVERSKTGLFTTEPSSIDNFDSAQLNSIEENIR